MSARQIFTDEGGKRGNRTRLFRDTQNGHGVEWTYAVDYAGGNARWYGYGVEPDLSVARLAQRLPIVPWQTPWPGPNLAAFEATTAPLITRQNLTAWAKSEDPFSFLCGLLESVGLLTDGPGVHAGVQNLEDRLFSQTAFSKMVTK